jgi:hypothetical protein
MGDQKFIPKFVTKYASEGTLSRWSRLHLQSLAPTNPHWARVVGYGPFSLCVIHMEGLCSSNGDINRLMITTSMGEEGDILIFCHKNHTSFRLSDMS